jgi:hypothetical protein
MQTSVFTIVTISHHGTEATAIIDHFHRIDTFMHSITLVLRSDQSSFDPATPFRFQQIPKGFPVLHFSAQLRPHLFWMQRIECRNLWK